VSRIEDLLQKDVDAYIVEVAPEKQKLAGRANCDETVSVL
jgi:hypothetical protein